MFKALLKYKSMSTEERKALRAKFDDAIAQRFAEEIGLNTKKRGELNKIMRALK